jgi:hypothetical protein
MITSAYDFYSKDLKKIPNDDGNDHPTILLSFKLIMAISINVHS